MIVFTPWLYHLLLYCRLDTIKWHCLLGFLKAHLPQQIFSYFTGTWIAAIKCLMVWYNWMIITLSRSGTVRLLVRKPTLRTTPRCAEPTSRWGGTWRSGRSLRGRSMNQKMNLVEHVASGLSLWTAAISVTRWEIYINYYWFPDLQRGEGGSAIGLENSRLFLKIFFDPFPNWEHFLNKMYF